MGRTKRTLTQDVIDSEKIQTLNLLCYYEQISLDDMVRLKQTRTLVELKHMLSIRRLYSQVYGNPEGETAYYD